MRNGTPKSERPESLPRREVLKGIAGLGISAFAPLVAAEAPAAPVPSPDLIRKENERKGSRDWMLSKTYVDPQTRYRSPRIEGYASRASLRAGETISFFASTNPPSPFMIEIYRMGFYGGAGGRLVARLGPLRGKVQQDPPVGPKRLRECRWEPAASLKVPADWPSGVYVGKLTTEREGFQSYLIFIVRDDRPADFIFQCSDTTWQAYNRWPSQFSLYDDGKKEWYWGPGFEISFDRPYGKYCQILDAPLSIGSGEWFLWEFPISFWLESEGYDVTYVSNLDLHADPAALKRAKGFLSVGHDEYYSLEMFENLRKAIAGGLSVAFLSGNTCCGLIGLRAGSTGEPNRIFTRLDRFGPPDPVELKDFSDMSLLPFKAPNENTLIGARSTGHITGGADWTCAAPEHWIFEGTGMKRGEGIPGLVGWEWHGDPASIPGLVVVATDTTRAAPGGEGRGAFTATVYPAPKGNFVFNASSCWWGDGLSAPPGYLRPKAYTEPKGPDPRAQRITRNVLERMRAG